MEDFLRFSGPAKLLIVEKALLSGKNKSRKEGTRAIVTRLILNESQLPSSELRDQSTIDYEYNEYGQLISKTEKKKDGSLIEISKQNYRDNHLIKKERLSSDGTIRELREYKYNTDNQLIYEKCGSRNYKYQYNALNQIEKEYRYYGKTPELALLFNYDENGNPIEIRTLDSNGKQIRQETFTWKDGLKTSHFCLNENNVILENFTYEYSCFHDGNWLKRVRYSLKDTNLRIPVDVIYRSITYSDHYPEIKPVKHENLEILKEDKKSMSFSDGSRYRGDVHSGMMNGQGYIEWSDGSSYKGEFKNNKMDGKGILTWTNGDIYSGSFNRGEMEGIGRLRWKDGKTFYGLFENNRRTNQGIIEEN